MFCRIPALVFTRTIALPLPYSSMHMTMYSIMVDLVIVRHGSMSIFRLSSFSMRMSPSSVFSIRWMVIIPMTSAIFRQAATTAGTRSSLVYPDTQQLSYASCSRILTPPDADRTAPDPADLLFLFLLISYTNPPPS